jgi:hypothetical protein
VFRRSLLRKEALKYPWLSIYIHDPMMKGRSWNLQGMESIEYSMDPRAKEKHEEEHEDSKKERKSRTTSYYTENHKDYQLGLNPLEENEQKKRKL